MYGLRNDAAGSKHLFAGLQQCLCIQRFSFNRSFVRFDLGTLSFPAETRVRSNVLRLLYEQRIRSVGYVPVQVRSRSATAASEEILDRNVPSLRVGRTIFAPIQR